MKTTSWIFAGILAVAVAAPAPKPEAGDDDEGALRVKRSQYGPAGGYAPPSPVYGSPCAAASHLSYPVHAGYGPHGYGPGAGLPLGLGPYGSAPHYRAAEGFDDPAMLMEMQRAADEHAAVDMQRAADEHAALARTYSYEGVAGHAGGAVLSPHGHPFGPAYGPAVGVFPKAHVGGCNVPLMLSCAPSIVAGQMLPTKPHFGGYGSYGSAGAGALGSLYRGADDGTVKEARPEEMHQAMANQEAMHDSHASAPAAHANQPAAAAPLSSNNAMGHHQ